MKPSPLTGESALPVTVEVNGGAFPIRHDFRAGIEFEQVVTDPSIPEGTRVVLALDCWYGQSWPDCDIRELVEATMAFYRCGKPEKAGSGKRLYDFTHDWDMIYSAFLHAYNLDLLSVEYLHWWRFRAMLADLPEGSQFVRAVGYRGASPVKGMSDEQKRHLAEMKRLYAIPAPEDEQGYGTEADFREWLEEQKAVAAVAADRMSSGGQ